MEIFLYIITSAVVLLSAVVFTIFSVFNFRQSRTHKGIAVLLLFVFSHFLTVHLYLTGLILEYPHFMLVSSTIARLVIPMFFLIVWCHVANKQFSPIHLIHFVPFAANFVNFLPKLMLSAEEKKSLILEMETFGYTVVMQNSAFMSSFWSEVFRVVIPGIYILVIGFLVFGKSHVQKIPEFLQGFFKLTCGYLFIGFIPIVMASYGSHFMDNPFNLSMLGLLASLFFILKLFFMPGFLYGKQFGGFHRPDLAKPKIYSIVDQNDPVQVEELSSVKVDLLFKRIESFFEKHKPFLNPAFSLKTLEMQLNLSGRYISQAIKIHTGFGFKHYVHQKRMEYFYSDYQRQKNSGNKTMEEVAEDLGFISINTFYVQFKQATGMTPKEYLNNFNDYSLKLKL
jgi:AraC-like DNA-binding protein